MSEVRQINLNENIVQKNVNEVLNVAKGLFDEKFPNQNFDDYSWNIVHLRKQSSSNTNPNLYFTIYGSLETPLPVAFSEIVKCWLILESGNNVKSMVYRLDALRILWKAILSRRGGDATKFHWGNLTAADLAQTEQLMKDNWSDSTVYKRMTNACSFAKFLESRRLIFPIHYKIQTPRVEDTNRHTICGQEENLKKLPTNEALKGLADIYCKFAKEPSDRLLICAVSILIVTGFRIGELLTLPLDCEVDEIRNGINRYGLRFYKEKPGSAERQYDIRWITPQGAELARKLVAEIKEITFLFREQAKLLEQNPDIFPLPGYKWNDELTARETATLLGLTKTENLNKALKKYGRFENGTYLYSISIISNYLFKRRIENLWTLDRNNGTFQSLSETLLIAPQNFFHATSGVISLLIRPLNVGFVTDFITGKKGAKSVFERFEITEPDGTICEIYSHQFRHWINTIANKGGLPMELLSRWMGRDNLKDTQAYIHLTQEEKIEWVKKGIRDDITKEVLNEVYFSLPDEERDIFLDGQIQAVHFTHLGVCTHDFAVSPCEYHLNCVRGCPDYLRNKDEIAERQQLIQIKGLTKTAMKSSEIAEKDGNGSLAPAWIKQHEETISGINKALEIDNNSDQVQIGG
ncbi:MAG: hypothetical protein ACR2N3_05085 [Pyrinomonadaceae bacterium]